MDTDSDNDNENEVNLTGFLFGNIDSAGRLEDDIFDSESKKQLSSLVRLGIGNLLEGIENELESNDDDDSDSDDNQDYEKKSDTAEDFSDITELAEDLQTAMQPIVKSTIGDDYDDAIPASTVKVENAKKSFDKNDEASDKKSTDNDTELMPPPSLPPRGQINTDSTKLDTALDDQKALDKKLETPLAAMLPSKYANVDVRELFPDFRPDKVLRFSRLFGPGKPTSLPQIWRSVRKKRRKRKQSRDGRKDGSDSTSETDEIVDHRNKGFISLSYGTDPSPDMIAVDDEYLLLHEVSDETEKETPENNENGDSKPKIADWRYGPAQVWYDMLDVPLSGDGFNYGFKVDNKANESEEIVINGDPISDDAYLMVSQLHWEDDVVWDGNDIKHKVLQKLNSKMNAAGWLPSSGSRTAGAFSQPGKGMPNTTVNTATTSKISNQSNSKMSKGQALLQKLNEETDDTWYSIFPVENEELIYSRWEDEVIWDTEAMPKVPKPKMLSLDPNDENIILGIPDDIDPSKIVKNTKPPPKIKIPHPHVKKSKILLGKAGVINVLAEDTPPPPPKSPDRDPFNISNDTFYMAKSSENTMRMKVGGGNLIQHSTPVVELRAPFIPTHMGPIKLRAFHRPPMKKYSHGLLAGTQPHGVQPLLKHIKKKAKQRELERIASGGGDVFFMRNPEDLSGKDGELILVEFTEEHPPLMNQVGMCSKIKNYYKRKAEKDSPTEFRYGEIAYAHTSPFLGILQPGRCIQTLENNMYRAPIYPHSVNETDFLLIRTRNEYYIREINALFTVAQECPLYEVPGPNSKRANNFVRDFLQVFIYRLFWNSRDQPRRIRMDDIKRAFPGHSESSIRKRLKQCADFKRTGMDSNWWVIKPEFRLPSEEEIRAMVSPEQCCAYFSMIAAEQRLKDAGYGEKFIFAQQDDDDEEQQLKMDDEVKVAPWNTTRAYIQAMRGKCLLQLTGPADPTGMGEGFSYVRIPNKPTQTKEEIESQPKRTVTGTDADLRRLSLNNAKAILRKYDVPEEEIKKLSRWEVIDVVRTLSTEKSKAGEEGMDKFSRGNRFSIAEHQERYKEECQRIFDLQNRVLASNEVLSTDEGESDTASEESDLEELGKNLENMLANKKTSVQLSMEREEQERQELLKKIMEERENAPKDSKKKDEDTIPIAPHLQPGRILRITRTFKNSEGKEFTRVEIVRRPQVIDAYVRIRTSKDEAFIRQFATLDEAQKEEMKREKRRIQEQLRRIKRNQEKNNLMQQIQQGQQHLSQSVSQPLGDSPTNPTKLDLLGVVKDTPATGKEVTPSRRKVKLKPDLKLKCGACGQVGHMRTNKACPLYTGTTPQPSVVVAMTEEQEEEIEKELNADDEDLVNVDGTKVKLSGKLLKRHEDVKRRTLLLKVPKDAVKGKRRRAGADDHCDYLRHNKIVKRSRTDPVVLLSSILEQILNDLREMPDVQPFLFPVNIKLVPDYYKVVQKPMDLQAIRDNLRQNRYQSRADFLTDVNQVHENSILYNGPKHALTAASERMLKQCGKLLGDREEKLMKLEKAINPLLDDNDQVALSFIFEKVVDGELKLMRESNVFKKPVNKKQFKDYYTVIRKPMDLETISKKVAEHKYHSRAEFLADITLIATNCEQYNGADSELTKDAKILVECTKKAFENVAEHCAALEKNIAEHQERLKIQAELDDTWADDDNDDKNMSRASSPENDFVDVESTDNRPHSSASGTSQKQSTSGIAVPPENKRSRGRPRKFKENSEEAKLWKMKRGRGRPRKNSMTSDLSNTQNSYLEEDLQFSTDDEEFEEVVGDNESIAATLGQGEALARSSQPVNYIPGGHSEDDSKQAAEAMVQLSGIGFYNQQDESLDVDPNYDPSDFLQMSKMSNKKQTEQDYSMGVNIKQETKPYQEEHEEKSSFSMSEMLVYSSTRTEEPTQYQPSLSPSFTTEFLSQQKQQSMDITTSQQNISRHNEIIPDVGIHDDLAISSDSEDEQQQQNTSKNLGDNADNDDALWF